MKRIVLLLPVVALLAGCVSHYNITLQNGQVITALTKPVLDKNGVAYTYKTIATIPAGSVREIAPAGAKPTKDSQFLPTPTNNR